MMTSSLPRACLISLIVLAVCTLTVQENGRKKGHFRRTDLFKQPKIKKTKAVNKSRFTDEEKELIVEIHNAYRSSVEPPATDMREIVWDDELEQYAYDLTQSCTGAHSKRTMVYKNGKKKSSQWRTLRNMNENLYYHYAPEYSIKQALWMFWEEGKAYDIATQKCTHKNTCGHYLSMTTAENTKVGCAINTCKTFSVSKYPPPANFMACVYDGSYPWGKPYTVGERCSDCTREKLGYDAQYCRNGLCISPALYFRKIGYDGSVDAIDLNDADRVPDGSA